MDDAAHFQEQWPRNRDRLKKEYPQLSDEDLRYDPGKEEELLLRLQQKLNKTKHEIRNWLSILG
jgi:hypothetical protein